MKKANYLLPVIVLLAVINCFAQTNTPDALIRDLYKTHDKNNGAIVQGKNRAILNKYFNKNLSDLIWTDMTTNQGEVGVIDFDVFYNAQDTEIKNLAVGAAKINGGRATVPVNFENFNAKNTLVYSLVKEKTAWKISDINYGTSGSLLKYFSESSGNVKNPASATTEFEGKYQVGDMMCVVKPIKMAFEVKWAKGGGSEIFFYEERTNGTFAFATDPKTGKPNVFSFDDENYDTGTFYRADGKQFPLRRVR